MTREPNLTELRRVDHLADQFEESWQRGQPPRIEDFLEGISPTLRRDLLEALLRIDLEHRRRTNQPRSFVDYLLLLPDDGPVIANVLAGSKGPDTKGVLSTHCLADDQTVIEASPLPGERLLDFQIVKEMGRGAFGTVYRAWQVGMDREVALKVSRASSHEPRTLSKLDGHPNIVRIYDQREFTERGLHLLYMEFVHGVNLREAIAARFALPENLRAGATLAQVITCCERGILPQPPSEEAKADGDSPSRIWVKQVCAMGAQIADALHFAHRKRIYHCDIKPANIVLSGDGFPKVVDFNTSYTLDIDEASVGGTLAYMAPEQLAAFQEIDDDRRAEMIARLDGRNDIYSLGLVLWEALVGRRPFEDLAPQANVSETLGNLVRQRLQLPAERTLASLPSDTPQGVRRVLAKCLAPDPDDRYANAGELAHELRLACNDDYWDLLYPPEAAWREWVLQSWATFAGLLLVGMLPNAAMSLLDTVWIVQLLNQPQFESLQIFFQTGLAVWVNAVAYGFGGAAGVYLGWPIVRALRDGPDASEETLAEASATCVTLGRNVAVVSLLSWIAASIAYGIFIWCGTSSVNHTIHVVGSLFLGGLIAAPITYFPLTYVCIHLALPRFVRVSRKLPAFDVEGPIEFYSRVAVLAPLLAIGLFLGLWSQSQEFSSLVILLIVISAVSYAATQYWAAAIRTDVALLEKLRLPATL